MIAGYAWTDTQIINILQVCRTKFPLQQADLFVLRLSRISESLLQILRRQKIFRKVVEILPPNYEDLSGGRNLIPGAKTIYQGRLYQRWFDSVLENDLEYDWYSDVLIPGFWAESLHWLCSLKKRFRKFKIHLVEEGFYHYVKDPLLCRLDSGNKELVERLLRYGLSYWDMRKRVDDIYLYEPKNMVLKPDYPVREIPKIDITTGFWKDLLCSMVPPEAVEKYSAAKLIYLVGAHKAKYEPNSEQTGEILKKIVEKNEQDTVIVRTHPTLNVQKKRSCFTKNVALDDQKYWFEALYAQIDFSSKVLITRNSSALTSLYCMENIRPTIIMTYKLYDHYRVCGDPVRDYISEILSKDFLLFVPKNMDELLRAIDSINALNL